MILKPQDVMVAIWVMVRGWPGSYAALAKNLRLSPSEAHAATRRAIQSDLLHAFPVVAANRSALEEFLVHGLRYSFPAMRGPLTRGMPTSYAAPPLDKDIATSGDDLPVWPDPEGEVRGYELKPLYPSMPKIAREDPDVYEWFALIDAIRSGRPRERNLAEEAIRKRIHARPDSQS